MRVTLINPNIVMQKGDYFGTGIPYMPVTLAYLAGYLRQQKFNLTVIDAFGLNPKKMRLEENHYYQGLNYNQIVERIPDDTKYIVVYASLVAAYDSIRNIIKNIRKTFEGKIIVIENTQSVIAFSLMDEKAHDDLFSAGADFVVLGECEHRVKNLIGHLEQNDYAEIKKMDGLIYYFNKKKVIQEKNIDNIIDPNTLPFPAWELFPLRNYWNLKYSHAPFTSGKYITLLTSRGCTYQCRFCIVSITNNRKWRARNAKNTVDEMEYWFKKFKVREFHLEDLNPTINKQRMVEISKEIISRGLKISWKFAAGTKIDTFDIETLEYMARAGCSYISFSPESGSPELMKIINKPFDYNHAAAMVKRMYELKVVSQACFVLGFPGETDTDLMKTKNYIKRLTKLGLDETALFIITPIPGSAVYNENLGNLKGYKKLEELTFTPKWRKDYKKLAKFRTRTYTLFFWWKFIYHPLKFLKQFINVITGHFETKIEMTAYRTLKLKWYMMFARKIKGK